METKVKTDNWISVKDGLPDIGDCQCTEVLCVMNGSIRICDYITGGGKGSFYTSYKKVFDEVTSMVTHWMPLPEPPTKLN